MRHLRTVAFGAVAAVTVATLGACGTGEADSGDTGDGQLRIGVSLLTQSHPFYVNIKEAMEAEALAQGVDLTISIADQDLNKQVAQVEDFINMNVDAVILSPVDSDGVTGAIKKADEAGIPVVTVDISANNAEVASHVATDNLTGGKIAAAAMAELTDGSGEIGVITYPEVQSVQDRIEGFKTVSAQFDGLEIVKELPGRDRQAAKAASEDMLTSAPNIAGIFGFGDDMALAATQAIANAGSGAIVVGFDGMEEALNSVDDDNAFKAVVVQYPDKMGSQALLNAIAAAKGENVEKLTPITPGLYVEGKGEVPVTVDGDNITVDLK